MTTPKTEPPVDYGLWKVLAWCGIVFMAVFVLCWGVLSGNMPPFSPAASAAEIKQHYIDNRLPILIGMSICVTVSSAYAAFSCGVSQVMRRVEGRDHMLSNLELMGGTLTVAPIIVVCGIWAACAHEALTLPGETLKALHWVAWLTFDLAYLMTTFQIAAISIVFMRDKREKPLVHSWVCWWGWVTATTFFAENLMPFFTTGPLALNGTFNFWIAFSTWFIWCPSLSYYIIKAIPRIKAEDEAAAAAGLEPRGTGDNSPVRDQITQA